MESFCAATGHSKYRPTTSYYQPHYARSVRQNEYSTAGRHSALLWQKRIPNSHSRGKLCSIALVAASFIVVIAVLCIGGLALYMGTLRTEPSSPLLTFSCSARIARGDRFVGALQEKAKRYRQQLEMLYQRSLMGPSLVSCSVERFGNDTLTIFYRLSFNRRKIPRSIPNVEKTLRDILLGDALSRKPIFKTVRFDPKSIFIRQALDADHHTPSYQRDAKPRETSMRPNRNGVVLKPPGRQNFSLTADLPVKKKPTIVDEPDIKEENLPVIHGSFKITKTDADITEKRHGQGNFSEVPESTTAKPKKPTRTTVKRPSSTTTTTTTSTTTTSTTTAPTTTTTTTTTTTSRPPTTATLQRRTSMFTTTQIPSTIKLSPLMFTLPPSVSMDPKPWIPMMPETDEDIRNNIRKPSPEVSTVPSNGNDQETSSYHFIGHVTDNRQPPIYTSFTNPSLSFYSLNAETLGTTSLKSHPIPINKIVDAATEPAWTSSIESDFEDTKTQLRDDEIDMGMEIDRMSTPETTESAENPFGEFIEVETYKYNPDVITEDANATTWEFADNTKSRPTLKLFNKTETMPNKIYNTTLQAVIASDPGNNTYNNDIKIKQAALLKNISSIFNNLASTLGIVPKLNETSEDKTSAKPQTTTTTTERNVQDLDNSFKTMPEEPVVGQGIVEVVMDPSDQELLLHQAEMSTKLPLVTLIPVKSNSGIGRPLRRRPQFANRTSLSTEEPSEEIRSFPTNFDQKQFELHDKDATKSPAPYVQTEVVTSISSEVSRIKINRSQLNDYKLVGVLNFAMDSVEDFTEASGGNEKRNTSKLIIQNIKNGIGNSTNSEEGEAQRNPKTDSNTTAETVLPMPSKLIQNAGNHSDLEINVKLFNNNNLNKSNTTKPSLNILNAEMLKQLADISVINKNNMTDFDGANHQGKPSDTIIYTKAVSSSFSINNSNFKLLTKTYNKAPITSFKDDEKKTTAGLNAIPVNIFVSNETACNNYTVKCGNDKCLPEATRCNQFIDCDDGSDEKNCTCSDYLRSQYLMRKICDGVVDCWDFSDENNCEWCTPEQYVCGNTKLCIEKTKICDGIRDCPHGDDERQCVTIAPDYKSVDEFSYHSEGYLMVRKHGVWGKFCTENFENVVSKSQTAWRIEDLGQAVCRAMTYQELDEAESLKDKQYGTHNNYFELSYDFRNETKSNLSFKKTPCISGQIIRVKCKSLECGARPQAIKQIARIVGGTNAGLGAWPWQAALYKEGEFQCGGTLLSNRWLLSAGHCFYHAQQDYWVARLGALRRGTALPTPYEQLRPIVKILLHPEYVDVGFVNDISLLRMETPIVFSDYVRPICLPNHGVAPKHTQLCTVVGWGQLFEVGRIFPDTLQEVQVPIISTAECRKRTVFLPLYRVTDNMFCAGFERGGRDACLGDSGGPLMCPEQDGRWTLHGVTSNGYGCARANRPGVYTKVGNYINWIKSHIEDGDNYKVNKNDKSRFQMTQCLGHRCPLGECLPKSRQCNGFIECSDGSDEKDCV